MPRGLSTILKTEIAKQSIKAIALVQIKFPTTQRFTNHYKDIEVSELWDDALGLWDDRNPTAATTLLFFLIPLIVKQQVSLSYQIHNLKQEQQVLILEARVMKYKYLKNKMLSNQH
jgi:hypothetical protein